ncbi:uncharacterized protein METZ01_LOCUS109444, partial [marine metagenome]
VKRPNTKETWSLRGGDSYLVEISGGAD